jgi:hypothetical protein
LKKAKIRRNVNDNFLFVKSNTVWDIKQQSELVEISIFYRLVTELQKCIGNVDPDLVEATIRVLEESLHPNHYLNLLAKRHFLTITGKNLHELTIEQLEKRKKLCKEVTF